MATERKHDWVLGRWRLWTKCGKPTSKVFKVHQVTRHREPKVQVDMHWEYLSKFQQSVDSGFLQKEV